MRSGIWRELRYLMNNKWDLALVSLAPVLIILLFSAMFAEGKPSHLPIAIIDQDHSELSQDIAHHIHLNHGLDLIKTSSDIAEVELLLNQNKIWGYITIPEGAEQRLVKAKDAQISIAYNQSYYSIGNTISAAMLVSTLGAISEFSKDNYLANTLPSINGPSAHIKISTLYNPGLNYELYLEPFLIPAILHLLLCCCVAFAVGQELKHQTLNQWVQQPQHRLSICKSLITKNLTYVLIFSFWTGLWLFWMIEIRGWFIAGHLWMLLAGLFLLYCAYALISTVIVLFTQNLTRSFGLLAVYGGSSLSFAGVTLPLNNAPFFTQFWSNIIPFTPYAKLQTEQWVIGSPVSISLLPFAALVFYCLLYFLLAYLLLNKHLKGLST